MLEGAPMEDQHLGQLGQQCRLHLNTAGYSDHSQEETVLSILNVVLATCALSKVHLLLYL